MITWITIKLLQYHIRSIEKYKRTQTPILQGAYDNLIDNYKFSIMFLKAHKNKR